MTAPSRGAVVRLALEFEVARLEVTLHADKVVEIPSYVRVAKDGSRTVRVETPIHESGRVVALYGMGHRTLFWREAE